MKTFLTNDQIETLQAQKWDLVPNGAYINLYPEDFNRVTWKEVCDQLGVFYETKEIQVLYFAKKITQY